MSILRLRARRHAPPPISRPARVHRLPVLARARARVLDAAHADLVAVACVVGSVAAVASRLGLAAPDPLYRLHAGRSVPDDPSVLFGLSTLAAGLPGGGHLAALAAEGFVPVERLRPLAADLATLAA